MDKVQALDKFWNSFGIPAYDENSVPDDAKLPYITYNVVMDNLDNVVNMYASIWYRSTSWREVTLKACEIGKHIVEMYPPSIPFDDGRLYIARGNPFAQRLSDPSDNMIRRIYLNIQVEYLSAF